MPIEVSMNGTMNWAMQTVSRIMVADVAFFCSMKSVSWLRQKAENCRIIPERGGVR